MAYKVFDADSVPVSTDHSQKLSIHGDTVDLPDASYVRDAHLTREGMDLVLDGPDGTVVIEGYFAAEPAPMLMAPDGTALTPQLVESFTTSEPQFAANNVASDVTPVGAVHEVSGRATVTHKDGTVEDIVKGTPIFEGDIVQTDDSGAVNIMFVDQTTFAVSEDAKLAIDKYVFDPSTQAGTTDFSILKGVFVFTSGLIGRDDPDQVKIETPAGSIGIRGTIIAGNVDSGEITVVEGAIVLHDFQGNEITLATQFDTARFVPGGHVEHVGQLSAHDVGTRFSSVSGVSPTLFSNIHQNEGEQGGNSSDGQNAAPGDAPAEPSPTPADNHSEAAPQTVGSATIGLANTSGFGDTSGFAASTSSFSTPAPTSTADAHSAATLAGIAANAAPPAPQGETISAPATTNPYTTIAPDPAATTPGGTTTVTNHTPFLLQSAPQVYFESATGRSWGYSFRNEFGDQDLQSGDTLHFSLDQTTIDTLATWTVGNGGPEILMNGAGIGRVDFTGDEGQGWTFDPGLGELILNFNPTMTGVTNFQALSIFVNGIDASGASTQYSAIFRAYDSTLTLGAGTFAQDFGDTVYADNHVVNFASGAASVGTIVGDFHRFYFNLGADIITLDDTGSATDNASFNYLNMGDGNNTVIVSNDAYDNVIVGGKQNDTFVLRNGHVQAFGVEGDDKFVLDNANGPVYADLTTVASNTIIEGGSGGFHAGDILRGLGLNTFAGNGLDGRGDTLELQGAGTLDFGLMTTHGNSVKGFERLDTQFSTSVQTVILSYDSILGMTDDRTGHTLIINRGANDFINLEDFAAHGMVKVMDDQNINTGTSTTPENHDYDVYSNGQVTVLINHLASGNVNIDGVTTPT